MKDELFEIQVDEPWRFDVGNGTNIFRCKSYNKFLISSEPSVYWIMKVTKPFKAENVLVKYITVSNRYVGDNFADFLSGKKNEMIIGAGIVLDDSILLPEAKTFDFDQVKYFAIGQIKRIPEKTKSTKK